MKLTNAHGQAVYYNTVYNGKAFRYRVQAASGQQLISRDKQRCKSRNFSTEAAALKFLSRYGYTKAT